MIEGSSASTDWIAAGRCLRPASPRASPPPGSPPRLLLRGESPAKLGEGERQQKQSDELCSEGLGRGHADLGACAGEIGERGLSHHRAGRHVANRERLLLAKRSGVLERRERIGGLA